MCYMYRYTVPMVLNFRQITVEVSLNIMKYHAALLP